MNCEVYVDVSTQTPYMSSQSHPSKIKTPNEKNNSPIALPLKDC
jgi:hypothetical protein